VSGPPEPARDGTAADPISDTLSEEASLAALRDALQDLRAGIRGRSGPHAPSPPPAEPRAEERPRAGLAPAAAPTRPDPRGRPAESSPASTAESEPDWLLHGFDRARRSLGTFGMGERAGGEVDEFGMDPELLARALPVLDFLMDRFWRIDLEGPGSIPDGPALLVANHAGLVPYDGLMLAHAAAREHPDRPRPRFLVADWLMTQPFAQPYLARIGGVRACRENATRLLRTGHSVIAFPEGERGAAKVFAERYQLKRFGRGGVVRVAAACGVPLVPIAVVGAEEAQPVLFKAPRNVPVTPTFPWLGPIGLLPLPTKWVIRIGDPISVDGLDDAALADELLLSRLTEQLRASIQELVNDALKRRASVWR